MCAGAIINARVPRVVYGTPDLRFGAFGSLLDLAKVPLNHTPEVKGGVLAEETRELLTNYFRKKRKERGFMKKAKKVKDLRFKDYFGTTAMALCEGITAALMTSWFMVYLTDYAGLGAWGASLGAGLLMFGRLFDAVNDPIEAWIMDRAKVGKYGKYKPFIFLSILMMAVGVSALFFIPSGITSSPVAVAVWVIVGYLLYDIGYSFFAPNLIYRTLTTDQVSRSKLIIGPRMIGMLTGMVTGSLSSAPESRFTSSVAV